MSLIKFPQRRALVPSLPGAATNLGGVCRLERGLGGGHQLPIQAFNRELNTLDLQVGVGQVDVTASPGLSGRFMVTALPTIFHVKVVKILSRVRSTGLRFRSLVS